MRHFSISVDIAAPPERVWQVMSEVERWPEWTRSVREVRRLGNGGPLQVGSRVLVRQPAFPPALWKVTALDPGKSFAWTSAAPGLRVVASHRVDGSPSGTSATLSLELHGLFGSLFGRMTKEITERYLAMEADGLRKRSEDSSYTASEP
jgi:uncharacterized protein YndB with AHSA1/START domain